MVATISKRIAEEKHSKPDLVVAIDFGTARSGYAMASVASPDRILVNDRNKQEQTRTCLLMDEKGEVLEFGDEAIEEFYRMDPARQRQVMLFDKVAFRRLVRRSSRHSMQFKMRLHGEEAAGRVTIQATNSDKEFSAEEVFTAALRHINAQVAARAHVHSSDD